MNKNKTFEDGAGSRGVWKYRANTLTVQYTDGCYATFTGDRFNGDQFWGEMNCRDGSGGHGTWSGFRTSGSRLATQQSSPGRSAGR